MTIRYPFHPLVGQELAVLAWHPSCRKHGKADAGAHPAGGCVTVRGPDGSDLKVPQWMLSVAAQVEISSEALVVVEALLALVALVEQSERVLTSTASQSADARRSHKEEERSLLVPQRNSTLRRSHC